MISMGIKGKQTTVLLEMEWSASCGDNPSSDNNAKTRAFPALETDLRQLELSFAKSTLSIVASNANPTVAPLLRSALMGDATRRILDGTERPLSKLLRQQQKQKQKCFVLRFPGDPTASQVATLRQEVKALVLHIAQQQQDTNNHVLVILQTDGGTETGYGLAGAQLAHLKNASGGSSKSTCSRRQPCLPTPPCWWTFFANSIECINVDLHSYTDPIYTDPIALNNVILYLVDLNVNPEL